ncbi:MOSC domain-containing protein [Rhodococcus aerolatus]
MARVASIHRYPVKSVLGEDLTDCVVTERGLVGDRGWALVDADDGVVASAKNPRKWAALLGVSARYLAEPRSGEVPPPVELTLPDGSVLRSDDAGVDAALEAVTGRPVRLTSVPPEGSSFEEVWPDVAGLAPQRFIDGTRSSTEPTGESVSTIALGSMAPAGTFFDLAVLHVLTTSTLAELARLAPGADFDARRYRPNLLLHTDDGGFAEDAWVGTTLAVGDGLRCSVSMLAMRCVMTTLAQRDLPADPDTLRAIARHHREEIPGLGTWACAGVYAGVEAGGTVRVGDAVG